MKHLQSSVRLLQTPDAPFKKQQEQTSLETGREPHIDPARKAREVWGCCDLKDYIQDSSFAKGGTPPCKDLAQSSNRHLLPTWLSTRFQAQLVPGPWKPTPSPTIPERGEQGRRGGSKQLQLSPDHHEKTMLMQQVTHYYKKPEKEIEAQVWAYILPCSTKAEKGVIEAPGEPG